MKLNRSNNIFNLLVFFILTFLIFILSKNIGIFWDNIKFVSIWGNEIYDHHLKRIFLENRTDSGHPPFLSYIEALSWTLFGKKLWISHLVVMPFIYALMYQLFRFVSYYIKDKNWIWLAFLLIILDPTLLTQFFIVSPEPIQLFFFFWAINSILFNKKNQKILALLFLGIVSYRAMMLCVGVFLFDVYLNFDKIKKDKIQILKSLIFQYLIASLFAVIYLGCRFYFKGWIFYNFESGSENGYHFVGIKHIIKNIIVLIHWFLDFGRVFILLFIFLVLLRFKHYIKRDNVKKLLTLSFSSSLIVILISIFMDNPFGHRYFLTSYICLILLSIILLQDFKYKYLIYCIFLVGSITGNFWIYPKKLSQGWDASLACLPYFELRHNAIQYLEKNNIPLDSVASFFPNDVKLDDIDMNKDYRAFPDFSNNKYVFYSNVYNLDDNTFDILDKNYSSIKHFEKRGVVIEIYRKNALR